MTENDPSRILHAAQEFWDEAADAFDESPDHGLTDPLIRGAWADLLQAWLPPSNLRVLDLGCGTGSLSLLLAQAGGRVTGIDLSPRMIALAEAKASATGQAVDFAVMDAADPRFAPGQFDLLLCRHLLWALPQPAAVPQRWKKLLRPGGQLILIEGFWHTGAGLHAQEILDMLSPLFSQVSLVDLSARPVLWGGPVADERYAILASDILASDILASAILAD
jgi:SAM-dependent methyltransferase